MFRTLMIISAISVVATPAAAAEVRVSLKGKSEQQVRVEVLAASRQVCSAEFRGTEASLYLPCLSATFQRSMLEAKALQTATRDPAMTLARK